MTLVVIARVPVTGVTAFQRFEEIVLPLLQDHGGHLASRWRDAGGTLEVQLIEFSTRAALEAFRGDPRMEAASPLLAESGAVLEITEVKPV